MNTKQTVLLQLLVLIRFLCTLSFFKLKIAITAFGRLLKLKLFPFQQFCIIKNRKISIEIIPKLKLKALHIKIIVILKIEFVLNRIYLEADQLCPSSFRQLPTPLLTNSFSLTQSFTSMRSHNQRGNSNYIRISFNLREFIIARCFAFSKICVMRGSSVVRKFCLSASIHMIKNEIQKNNLNPNIFY